MAPTEQQRKAARAQLLAGAKKSSSGRVQRYLKSTEPTLHERVKSCLLLRGIKASDAMSKLLQELRALQAPNAKLLSKKNQIIPFDADSQHSLEFLATKNDCALFALASHNKKRPNNLVMGRTFDRQILDMAELGILRFKSMHDYGGSVPKKRAGSKPLLLFVGELWQHDAEYGRLQNLLTDFYRGTVVDQLVVTGLDHIVVFTAAAAAPALQQQQQQQQQPAAVLIHQRTYFCKLQKNPSSSNSNTPVPYLEPCGPDLDFRLRRTQWAEADLYKAARRQPEALRKAAKKKKNLTTNMFGETLGRLHLQKQNVGQMGGRKIKALRRAEKDAAQEERAALEEELQQEKEDMGREFQKTFGFAESEMEQTIGKKRK